jgi:hypothetical protein
LDKGPHVIVLGTIVDAFNATNFITTLIIEAIHRNGSISNFNVISQNIMYFDVGGVSVFQGYQTYIIVKI